jgi:hypothetical protein
MIPDYESSERFVTAVWLRMTGFDALDRDARALTGLKRELRLAKGTPLSVRTASARALRQVLKE